MRASAVRRSRTRCYHARAMSAQAFGIICLLMFAVPVPILAWLDRAPRAGPKLVEKAK